jgi:excisionase family DNA binding protein
MSETLFTMDELCDFLKVSAPTIRVMIKEDDLPATKVRGKWRFLYSAVIQWLENGEQEMKAPPQPA